MGAALKIREDVGPNDLRQRARRERDGLAAARMQAVAHALEGYSRAEAARLAGLERQALRDAVLAFNAHGFAGLYDRPRPGKACRLSEAQQATLKAIVLQGPDPEREGLSSYRLADICDIVAERFGVRYCEPGMSRLLRRLNLSHQKARPRHPQRDPAAKAWFEKKIFRRRCGPFSAPTRTSA